MLFLQRGSLTKHKIKNTDRKVLSDSQRAQKIMKETNQDKILKDGIESNYLLTEATLAKHDLLTGLVEIVIATGGQ